MLRQHAFISISVILLLFNLNFSKVSNSFFNTAIVENSVPQEVKKDKDKDKKQEKTKTPPKKSTDKKSVEKKEKKTSTVSYPTLLEVIRGQNNESINTK
ncbi:hypothetical protein EI427_24385 [Flammeovirga pectinis]|uniref:Uncharacterized protein n=1 Tax=Flammeovirga pectinis TaxID=2494373 RepID=A0A3S9PB67_9BACT|nr:hypothetical protein [Flammeovirga pectinis]AZQ65353.1 hypothetical protein EI427_24385 [Flammeovirga pectinis]